MDVDARVALEAELTVLLQRGNLAAVADRAIRSYGPELLGFLTALVRDDEAAGEVFAQLCEDAWRGLPTFEQRASVRTWLYTLARHCAWRQVRQARRHARAVPGIPLEGSAIISRLAAEVRSITLPHLRSVNKNRLQEMREELSLDDQALLILRVDKQLDWAELARVLADSDGEALDDAAVKREAARLRKRFQLVKEQLRKRAHEEGLLDEPAG